MKNLFVIMSLFAASAAPAFADDTPQPAAATAPAEAIHVRVGQNIYMTDGQRLGAVDRLSSSGAPIVLSNGRYVRVALDSLSRQDGKIVTSLTHEALFARY